MVRKALLTDISAITEIYNNAILNTIATFDTEPKSISEQQSWFLNHGEKYPVLVAEKEGDVLGWASLSQWSDRCAYSGTAENSVYVRASARGYGVGKKLLEALITQGKNVGLHTVIARIVKGSDASIRLHENAGFVQIGTMKEVGFKFGKKHDVYLFQKMLKG